MFPCGPISKVCGPCPRSNIFNIPTTFLKKCKYLQSHALILPHGMTSKELENDPRIRYPNTVDSNENISLEISNFGGFNLNFSFGKQTTEISTLQ